VILNEQEFHTDLVNHALNVMQPTSDGSYIVCGSFSNDDILNPDPLGKGGMLMKLDAQGDTIWWKRYGDEVIDGKFFDMVVLADGCIVVTGYALIPENIPILAKFTSDGDLLWYRTYDYNPDMGERLFDIELCYDGGFILSGDAFPLNVVGSNATDAWILKVDSMGCAQSNCLTATEPAPIHLVSGVVVSPNPATDAVQVQWELPLTGVIAVLDMQGRELYRAGITEAIRHSFDCSGWPSGAYILRLETREGAFALRWLKT
jgi:hypothetical protein